MPLVGEVLVAVPGDVVIDHDLRDRSRLGLDTESAALVDDAFDAALCGQADDQDAPEVTNRILEVWCPFDKKSSLAHGRSASCAALV
jgi:hypothetical protein